MLYSFIKPKPKSILKRVTKVWIVYTLLAVLCMFLYSKVIELQIIGKINEQTKIESDTQGNKLKIIVLQEYIQRLEYEIQLSQSNAMRNDKLREAINNIVKLIPDQITLKAIELNDNRLVLRGITPSREVYKFLLEAPLRAIFTQTRVEFYPLVNGWFNFMSINKTNPTIHSLLNESKDTK